MTLQETINKLSTIKKGRITKVTYVTTKVVGNTTYEKVTKTLIRFVEYAHIKGVQVKGKGNPNESHSIPNMLIYNKNTNKYYLQMATVNSKHKAQVSYYCDQKPITKADYELANPPRPNTQPLVVFRKDITDIISLG